jgi:hypothetical protein
MLFVFLAFFYLPIEWLRESHRVKNALWEALYLARWYAQEHVLLCLVPAFFIAGAMAVFVSQASVMRYLGAGANKLLSYGVASVSGTVLAVCSCTVLPLFAGIYRMGAGLGPATAFLYSGPAINVLAIILTARILGLQLGVARAVGAVVFSIVIGVCMHLLFRNDEMAKASAAANTVQPEAPRPLWQNALFFASMIALLVFANWAKPEQGVGIWSAIYGVKWWLTSLSAIALGFIMTAWMGVKAWKLACVALPVAILVVVVPGAPMISFAAGVVGLSLVLATDSGEGKEWFGSSYGFAKQIMPLLLGGVLIAGALLGRPGSEGLIPSEWVTAAVGGNSLWANLFASVAGAFMYFATLTEVPIVQGLVGSGMGKGPALALLLAGPALSLPNMLVIRSVMGTRKTLAFILLVVILATLSGIVFGAFFGETTSS